jgi:hypothetical protein
MFCLVYFYFVSAQCLAPVILKFEINKCYSTCSSVTFRFHFISRPIWMTWIMFIRFAWAFDNTNWSRKSLRYWHPNGHKLLTFTCYLFFTLHKKNEGYCIMRVCSCAQWKLIDVVITWFLPLFPSQGVDFKYHTSWSFSVWWFEARVGCSLLWNCWLSLFKLSLHNFIP